jgi:ferredoxin--NADP+ reductase
MSHNIFLIFRRFHSLYRIVNKKVLNPTVILMDIEAPLLAKKAEPGQFIMLRVDENGERTPFTIADYDREKGTITIIFQVIGKTTKILESMNPGDYLLDFVGPLGKPTEVEDVKKVCIVGGGVGSAVSYPQAKKLHSKGLHVDVIMGFRNKDLVILEDEMKAVSTNLYIATEDGSKGEKGFVTNVLKRLIDNGENYDLVIAIGPLIMMKVVSNLTREYGLKTIVSMNSIMVDGTGMCGGCRVTVDGKTFFACVDGPEFDGHKIDFDGAMRRQGMYKGEEKRSMDEHLCRMQEQAKDLIASSEQGGAR